MRAQPEKRGGVLEMTKPEKGGLMNWSYVREGLELMLHNMGLLGVYLLITFTFS